MMPCAIEAKKGRSVVVTDIPAAFLHADMDQDMHMFLEGTIGELIVRLLHWLYRKYIWKYSALMLYLKLNNAL